MTWPPPGPRALIVEPAEAVASLERTIAEDAGFHVRTCVTGDEALQALPVWRPHVVISEIDLPDRDGFDLVDEARRAAAAPLAFILVSSRVGRTSQLRAAGLTALIAKPFIRAPLAEALERLAGQGSDDEAP